MKRFIILFLVVVFLPCHFAHGQLVLIDALVELALGEIGDQVQLAQLSQLYYMVENAAEQIKHLKDQADKYGKSLDMAVRNLTSIGDIKSFEEFTSWHDKQIALEKRVEDTLTGMKVSIGGKNYSLTDIQGWGTAVSDNWITEESFNEFWNKEFTEEQRREMWRTLGLSPASYAYVMTWKTREQEIARNFLAAQEVHRQDRKQRHDRHGEIAKNIADDEGRDPDDKMGEKELAAISAELLMEISSGIDELIDMQAQQMEWEAVKNFNSQTPRDYSPVSDSFDDVYFGRLN